MIRRIFLTLIIVLATFSMPAILNNTTQAAGPAPALVAEPQRKDYTVYITRTGERYHRGSCHHLRRSKIAIKKSEAIAQGYTPCKVCRP
jgi:hypothetical protein